MATKQALLVYLIVGLAECHSAEIAGADCSSLTTFVREK
jgi:hypothetical protein